jgi:hypothetical protein
MASKEKSGHNRRLGAVTERSQDYISKTEPWTKRDTNTDQFIVDKGNGEPFKEVRKEK